jgi:hypothetical protein
MRPPELGKADVSLAQLANIRLIRPQRICTGPAGLKVVPIAQR